MSTAKGYTTGFVPKVLIGKPGQEPKEENPSPINPEVAKYEKVWNSEAYKGGHSWGEQFVSIFLSQARPRPGDTVIDFGCGAGGTALLLGVLGKVKTVLVDFVDTGLDEDVRKALETQSDMISFVKHDLEQAIPVGAKFGYCVDVLEHIPENKVDIVLNNILKSAQNVFFSIDLRDDLIGEHLGEKLHLTVKPYSWWLEKFRDRNVKIYWSQKLGEGDGEKGLFYVSSWGDAKELLDIGFVNTARPEILDNVRANIRKNAKICRPYDRQDTPVMILAGGPSLNQFWDEIVEKRKAGQPLITINGTYNVAIEHGLKPSAQIIVDAREFNKRFVTPHITDCKYFLASQCHPSVFDAAPIQDTFIFHATSGTQPDINRVLDDYYYDLKTAWYPVAGGSTALLRSFVLLRMLGFWKYEVYGFDSCLTGAEHHAYKQSENDDEQIMKVVCDGKIFYCHPWMVSQAQEFIDQVQAMGDEVTMIVKGDGLISHILKTGAKLDDVSSVEELTS
jgi:hypothetical protein